MSESTPTTILVGPNNSGKTSVMDAVKIFLEQGKSISIHDLSVSQRAAIRKTEVAIQKFNQTPDKIAALQRHLPHIRLDLTFSYEDTPADLNLAQSLLMSLADDDNCVTPRIDFSLKAGAGLLQAYDARRHPEITELYDVIAEDMHAYFGFKHYKVSNDRCVAHYLKDSELRHKLIKLDMVPAQRHMDDHEDGKAAKLSKLLHAHYVSYVQPDNKDACDDIEDLIRESSNELTKQYKAVFDRLIQRLRGFGYPQGSAKPNLDIRAEMSSETIYKDNTRVYYAAPGSGGSEADPPDFLPERYNGLGYKNLIYIVLRLETFRAALDAVPEKRPGVHLIGLEEPEAHLHPQMQAVFINEVSETLKTEDGAHSAQVILSTHASHIVSDATFSPIRYFRQYGTHARLKDFSRLKTEIETTSLLPKEDDTLPFEERIAKRRVQINAILKFLRRYIKLTHCDLLFADKAVLVEGRVEKLLIPQMIDKISEMEEYANFNRQFVTVLEIGGNYAHKIDPLLKFLDIPTLIITDIDSASDDKGSACPVADGTKTTNAVIRYYLRNCTFNDLKKLTFDEKRCGKKRIAFQTEENGHHGRSFEEAFIYANTQWIEDNIDSFTEDKCRLKKAITNGLTDKAYKIEQKIKKVDFALDLLNADGWSIPVYIEEGLQWLAKAERSG